MAPVVGAVRAGGRGESRSILTAHALSFRSMNRSPMLALNNGVPMPALGLGVFLSPAEQTARCVTAALRAGYRLVDTAAVYLNERAVGEGVRASGLARDDVFVTTKLWVTDFGYDKALAACEASIQRLGLDHIDLYLLHWPLAGAFDRTLDAWRAMERLLAEGRVRAIGVSNFMPEHLAQLCAASEVIPAVNQVELHPYFVQAETRAANERLGIVTQSWAPIGGVFGRKPEMQGSAPHPLEHPVIAGIAARLGKSPAQVIIRWHLDQGFSVIPKSVRTERIRANFDVLDFTLAAEDLAQIDALDTGQRAGPDPQTFAVDTYPADVYDQ